MSGACSCSMRKVSKVFFGFASASPRPPPEGPRPPPAAGTASEAPGGLIEQMETYVLAGMEPAAVLVDMKTLPAADMWPLGGSSAKSRPPEKPFQINDLTVLSFVGKGTGGGGAGERR